MEDKRILCSQTTLSDYDLVKMPISVLEDLIKRDLAHGLANELVKSDLIKIVEEPNFSHPMRLEKRIRAEVVVLSRLEYDKLRRKAESADKAKQVLINF